MPPPPAIPSAPVSGDVGARRPRAPRCGGLPSDARLALALLGVAATVGLIHMLARLLP